MARKNSPNTARTSAGSHGSNAVLGLTSGKIAASPATLDSTFQHSATAPDLGASSVSFTD